MSPTDVIDDRSSFEAEFKHIIPRPLLHQHFIVALLNDVYGIQARSGCACAGPYGHRLFSVDESDSRKMLNIVNKGECCVKLGWARVNFNYFIPEEEVDFIIEAVNQIAKYGWRLLPFYEIEIASGAFKHRTFDAKSRLLNLQDFSIDRPSQQTLHSGTPRYQHTLKAAKKLYKNAPAILRKMMAEHNLKEIVDYVGGQTPSALLKSHRWYHLPSSIARILLAEQPPQGKLLARLFRSKKAGYAASEIEAASPTAVWSNEQ
eukprot:c8489_g1_i4.p1 GENE.c8489_g1_i4~~c8489_g1_i4.p1  ORF type:complete len:261 (+),score=55.45 c8489_g1_i4:569-1351(+)